MTLYSSGAGEPKPGLEGIPLPGDVVAGKFVVEEVLGVGGMGVVLSARHAQLGQKVAIKFLRKDASRAPEAVNRFLREARAAVGLQSVHVARVTDVGVLEGGLPYMVMEYLVGQDLAAVLAERTTLPVSDAVDYLLQGMEAIAEAHAAGIVHRDLKPANLFLTRAPDGSPLVKVLDFGISKASGVATEKNLTATGAIMGTPHYMSPEQLRSAKNVDARTDVWALGVILYELLVGQMPFEGDTATGVCAKIAADPPTPLRTVDPTLPAGIEAVVLRCLEKDVGRRLASVVDLAVVLQPFASAMGKQAADRVARIGGVASKPASGSAAVVSSSGAVPAAPGMQTDTAWGPMGVAPARRRMTPAAIGVGALLVVGIGVVGVRAMRSDAPAATTVIAAPPPPSQAAPPALVPVTLAAPPVTGPSVAPTPDASTAAPTTPIASGHGGTSAPAGKRQPKPAASQAPGVDLLLERK